MSQISGILGNDILWTSLSGWLAAQVIKVILVFITSRKLDFRRLTGSGGMPSSHSAITMSLTMSIGFVHGFDSAMFAVSMILTFVVMYDASGVRRSAGQQAAILNKLVEDWGNGKFNNTDKKLKELLGHTPLEVIAGAILGTLIAVIKYA
ncbi:MAG: divergent PAP2 family protein [bacterium]|nr:divergent PAP2 family protein [bacterium]